MDATRTGTLLPAIPARRGVGVDLAVAAGLVLVYFLTGKLGLRLAFFHASATPVWPPTGIAIAAILLLGYRFGPAIWLGAFLVNLTTQGSAATSAGIATGNMLEALLAAWLIQRYADGRRAFDRAHTTFAYVLLTALSALVSAGMGVTSLALGGFAAWNQFLAVCVTWWLGDVVSALIVAPLIIIWSSGGLPARSAAALVEAVLMFGSVVVAGLFVFGGWLAPPYSHYPWAFLCLPPLVWAAFRFGRRGAIASAFVLSALAIRGTLQGFGPFNLSQPNESLLLLQAFMGTTTLTSLVLATLVAERRRASAALREYENAERAQAAQMDAVMRAVPAVVWIAHDPQCRVVTGNAASYELLRMPEGVNASKSAPDGERPAHFVVLKDGRELAAEELPVQRAARGETVQDFEEEVRFADGTSRFLLGNATPLHDAEGRVRGSVAAFVDITVRKHAEQRLALNFAVTRILAESPAVDEALERILQTICEALRWQVGVVWVPDRDTHRMHCRTLWPSEPAVAAHLHAVIRELSLAPGVGLPGRVWEQLRPVWIEDMATDDSIPKAPFALADGLHAAFAFPILCGDRLLGVVEFFSRQALEPDQHLLDMVEGIGSQLGQFIERKQAEDALRAKEAQVRLITDTTPVMLTQCSRDLRYRFVNRAYAERFGLTPDQIVGRRIVDVLGPAAFEFIRPHVERVLQGWPVEYEAELPHEGWKGRFVRVAYVPELDERGDVQGWVASMTDITERRRAEQAVRESEARFRTMADGAPVMIWVSGPDKLCTWFNRPWLDFVGRTIEQELGNGWAENVHPDDFDRCLLTYVTASNEREEFQIEYRLRRHDGVWRWVLDHGVPRYGASEEFAGYIGSCIDITERKQAEAALRDSQARLAGLVESAMDAIIAVDSRQQVVLFNPAAEKMFGRPAEGVIGGSLDTLLPERYRAKHRAHIENFGRTGVTTRSMGALGALSGLRADGTEFPIEASISQMDIDGQKLFTVILRDVTERKRSEAELAQWQRELEFRVHVRTAELAAAHQRLRAEITERKRLEAEIAGAIEREQLRLGQELHDGLGQQLTGIGFMVAALHGEVAKVSTPLAQEIKGLQRMIQQSIEETRTLAKGFYPVELERSGLLVAMLESARAQAASRGVSFRVESNGDPTCEDLSGPGAIQLFRIAQEAVHNAVKHGAPKNILIRLAASDGQVVLTVKDDGVGLPADLSASGGMGLRIMEHRARMIGGRLTVDTAPEGGVVVTCTAPVGPFLRREGGAPAPINAGDQASLGAGRPGPAE